MVVTFYEVRDRRGSLAAVHKRVDRPDGSKSFVWLGPDGSVGLAGIRVDQLPLYNMHLLDSWSVDDPIVIVEGEKSADALMSIGIRALGTVTGASSTPSQDVLGALKGRAVVLWPDADRAGRDHMQRIAVAIL